MSIFKFYFTPIFRLSLSGIACTFMNMTLLVLLSAQPGFAQNATSNIEEDEPAAEPDIFATSSADNILKIVVDLGVANSEQLKVALANAAASRYRLYENIQLLGPDLALSYTLGRVNTFTFTDTAARPETRRDLGTAEATLSMTLFNGLQSQNLIRIAAAEKRASAAAFMREVNDQILTTVRIYHEAFRAKEELRLAVFHLKEMYSLRARLAAKIETDSGLRGVRYRADKRVALLEENLAAARSNYAGLRTQLALLIKDIPSKSLVLPTGLTDQQLPENLESALEIADRGHPVIEQQQAQTDVQRYLSYVKLAEFSPQVVGLLNWKEESPLTGGGTSTNDTRLELVLSYDFNLFLPEVQAYRAEAMRKVAQDQLARLTRKQVASSVRIAWEDLSSKRTRSAAIGRFVTANSNSFEISERQFQAGKNTFADLIDAQYEMYTARVRGLVASVARDVAAYQLLNEIGDLPAFFSYDDLREIEAAVRDGS